MQMFKIEPFLTAGTKLKIVSEKNAGMAMKSRTSSSLLRNLEFGQLLQCKSF